MKLDSLLQLTEFQDMPLTCGKKERYILIHTSVNTITKTAQVRHNLSIDSSLLRQNISMTNSQRFDFPI